MLTSVLIVAIVMSVPITAIITDHNRRVVKIKGEFMRDEIELEKLKQQNFIMETEKMKIELEQMKLDYTTGKNDIMKI
jgi:predicted thioesterase